MLEPTTLLKFITLHNCNKLPYSFLNLNRVNLSILLAADFITQWYCVLQSYGSVRELKFFYPYQLHSTNITDGFWWIDLRLWPHLCFCWLWCLSWHDGWVTAICPRTLIFECLVYCNYQGACENFTLNMWKYLDELYISSLRSQSASSLSI
jgi:hypothetical protein